ncbi:MAG: MFS transporter [Magnetococcus sp. DMHC-6]
MISAFGIGAHEFGLLIASYSFSAAISGLLAATFIDRFERKKLLLIVLFLFSVTTLACGLASGYPTLLVARGLSGAFGGVMGALVQTMIGDVIPFVRRAKASGVVSTAFGLSTVAGVPISLWLANHLQWRAPFIFIALLTWIIILFGLQVLPQLRHHVRHRPPTHTFEAIFLVVGDGNHLRTLLYSALIIFSGFTVIPYITLYAVNNVAIALEDIPFVYLFGGAATLFTARLVGYWADLKGKVEVYRLVAFAAIVPLLVVTHIGVVHLSLWILCTTVFFVLISGRMIPAMTIITSAARPSLRGTFMSLNGTIQSLSMGLATSLAGFMITQNKGGQIVGYQMVGYVAMIANLLAIWMVGQIVMHDRQEIGTG